MKKVKAYKVFNPDWTCKGFQYEIGKTYEMNNKPKLCNSGFHACIKVSDCFSYYPFDPNNKVAEVFLMGDIVGLNGDKQASNKIKIVREVKWEEMLTLANSGYGNSGNRNSGNGNSGNRNSGDSNSGDSNSGNRNSGNRNSGNGNSGDSNSGFCNSGHSNSGDSNSGGWNSGHSNSGNGNSGDSNSGHSNSGNSNSGDSNSGNRNSGNRNSGNGNSGDSNSGFCNSGHSNSGNGNSGHFNTTTPDIVNIFNKPCKVKDWDNAGKPDFIYNVYLTKWICWAEMTDDEKKVDKHAYLRGGYLKKFGYKEAWKIAFDNKEDGDLELLKALPNFDEKVFEKITGICINQTD